jgi:hypothetical protein
MPARCRPETNLTSSTAASWMTEADQCILGYRDAEQQRLQRQAGELAVEAEWLFDQVAPLDGERVVEIGCGPRGCLDLLADPDTYVISHLFIQAWGRKPV